MIEAQLNKTDFCREQKEKIIRKKKRMRKKPSFDIR